MLQSVPRLDHDRDHLAAYLADIGINRHQPAAVQLGECQTGMSRLVAADHEQVAGALHCRFDGDDMRDVRQIYDFEPNLILDRMDRIKRWRYPHR